MDHETLEAIQAIGSLLAVAVAFVAVIATAKSKSFDARRAYVEFVLKQRLEAAAN